MLIPGRGLAVVGGSHVKYQPCTEYTSTNKTLAPAAIADPTSPQSLRRFRRGSKHIIGNLPVGKLQFTLGNYNMSVDDTAREPASEQTPLLRNAPDANENTPLPQEPSTNELIWILGSIWLGVFLAALGMESDSFTKNKDC